MQISTPNSQLPRCFDLVPAHKSDIARAERAAQANWEEIEPCLPQLLEWLQDMNWPVAPVILAGVKRFGTALAPYLTPILESDDQMWKYWIIGHMIAPDAELFKLFWPTIERIATEPDTEEKSEELDQLAQEVLAEANLN